MAKQKEGEARREREQQQVALLDNSRESREREQDAFRILERQVEGRRTAVPGVEEFEAGLSAFGAGGDAAMRALWEGQDEGLARDDVEMALGLLNVDFGVEGRVGMEDLWAGLTLLGLRTSVRVDEFLLEMEREGR